ncbi:hypothetical protein [Frankia tisae]|uniref:hypothetical protein n=1 Tax=Frankia tisae TaxID=2950104 RepID=UPI003556E8E9
MEQLEPAAVLLETHQQAPRPPGDPGCGRMVRDAEDIDVAGGALDDEEHVDPLQEHGVDGEEITGQQAGCLRGQERPPRAVCSPRCRADAGAVQDPPDGGNPDRTTQPDKLAMDPAVWPVLALLYMWADTISACAGAAARAASSVSARTDMLILGMGWTIGSSLT